MTLRKFWDDNFGGILLILIGICLICLNNAHGDVGTKGLEGMTPPVASGGGSGTGDVEGPASASDGGLVLFDGTTGKLIKMPTSSGYAYVTTGVFSVKSGTSAQYLRADGTVSTLSTAVLATTLSGYTSGAGTVSSSDTILQAIQKLNGNTALKGDAFGPSSSTDNAICRYDGTTGKLLQGSTPTISDSGVISATSFNVGGAGNASFTLSGTAGTFTWDGSSVFEFALGGIGMRAGQSVFPYTDASSDIGLGAGNRFRDGWFSRIVYSNSFQAPSFVAPGNAGVLAYGGNAANVIAYFGTGGGNWFQMNTNAHIITDGSGTQYIGRLGATGDILPFKNVYVGTGIVLGASYGDTITDPTSPGTIKSSTTGTSIKLESVNAGTALNSTGTKPTCNSTRRREMFYEAGGTGVADVLYVCMKDAADAYSWVAK